ncbi:hypothetical protein BG005_005678 [Podila minutissima]|nr:hypothetical protein BG005_005678 [Podila minutissima]
MANNIALPVTSQYVIFDDRSFQAICGSLYAWSVFNDPIDGFIYGTVLNPATNKSAPPVHNAAITFYIAVGEH